MLITLLYGWKEAPKFLLNQKKKKKKKFNTENCDGLAYCMGLRLVGIKIKTKEHYTYKRSVRAHAKFEARQPKQPTFQNLYKRGRM